MIEKRISLSSDSYFFINVFLPVIKTIKYPKNEAIVVVTNKDRTDKMKMTIKDKYKLVLDYVEGNDSVVGIDVFYLGEEI